MQIGMIGLGRMGANMARRLEKFGHHCVVYDPSESAVRSLTETGATARLLSKYRPGPMIYALSPHQAVINRSMLLWGTYPILCDRLGDTDKLVHMAENILEDLGYVQQGQVVGIVAGTRTRSGATNFMRLHTIGDQDTDAVKPGKSGKSSKSSKKSKKKK